MHSKDLKRDEIKKRAFYLDGEDFYWRDFAINFFINLVKKENCEINVKVFDKLENLEEILFSLSTFGFCDDNQILIIKDYEYKAKTEELKELREVLSQDIEPFYLIFDNTKFISAKEKKLLEKIDCNKLENFELSKIVSSLFDNNKGIEKDALNLLMDYTQQDMSKISLESKKLLAYSDGERVQKNMVELLVNQDFDIQIFEFINALVAKNKNLAIKSLDRLQEKGVPKSYILAVLIKQYRRLLHSSLSPKSNEELSKIFKVNAYAIKKAREIKINKIEIKNNLDMLIDYELKFKSGVMSEKGAFDAVISELLAG